MSTSGSMNLRGEAWTQRLPIREHAAHARRGIAPTLLGIYLAFNLVFVWVQAVAPALFLYGPLRRAGLLLGLLMLIVAIIERQRNLPSIRELFDSPPFLFMTLLIFLPSLLFIAGRGTSTGWYRYVANFAIFSTAMLCIVSARDFRQVMFLYLLGCLVSVGVGLYCWAIATPIFLIAGSRVLIFGIEFGRMVGASTDPSTFGHGIVLVLPFCMVYGGQLRSKIGQGLFSLLCAVLLAAIAASVSRSSAILAVLGILLVAKRTGFQFVRTIVVLAACVFLLVLAMRGLAPENFSSTYELYQRRFLTDSRGDAWSDAFQALAYVGPIGRGPGSEALRVYAGQFSLEGDPIRTDRSTHNFYLFAALELGWPGLFFLLALVCSAYTRFARLDRVEAEQLAKDAWIVLVLRVTLIEAAVGLFLNSVMFPMTPVILGCSVAPLLNEFRHENLTGG